MTDDESGWRGKDQARINELKKDFGEGKFGINILTTISVLKDKTLTNTYIIDDGLSTGWALTELLAEFTNDKDKQPSGEPWPENLAQVLETGVPDVQIVVYEPSADKEHRKMIMAARHMLENNKFRFTPANICADCGEMAMRYCGMVKKDAGDYLCKHLGTGSAATARRWIMAAECFKGIPLARQALEARHT